MHSYFICHVWGVVQNFGHAYLSPTLICSISNCYVTHIVMLRLLFLRGICIPNRMWGGRDDDLWSSFTWNQWRESHVSLRSFWPSFTWQPCKQFHRLHNASLCIRISSSSFRVQLNDFMYSYLKLRHTVEGIVSCYMYLCHVFVCCATFVVQITCKEGEMMTYGLLSPENQWRESHVSLRSFWPSFAWQPWKLLVLIADAVTFYGLFLLTPFRVNRKFLRHQSY